MKGFLEKYDLHVMSNDCLVRPGWYAKTLRYVTVFNLSGEDSVFLIRELRDGYARDDLDDEMWEAAKEFFEELSK